MKIAIGILSFIFITHYTTIAQTEFELDTQQSMIMTGKGPGQDGTINPFYGEDCYAIVKNIGELEFSIRIQQDGKIIKELPIV